MTGIIPTRHGKRGCWGAQSAVTIELGSRVPATTCSSVAGGYGANKRSHPVDVAATVDAGGSLRA